MRIGIISGSIREGRRSTTVAQWVARYAAARDPHYEVLELADFDVPLLTSATIPGAAAKHYDDPRVQAWSDAVDVCDAFVFVTPEYNHSVPGAFKNAFDSLGPEWARKAVAFVGYGANHGVRAVEAWRPIVANFHMFDVRTAVALSVFAHFDEHGPKDDPQLVGDLSTTLDELESIAAKLV